MRYGGIEAGGTKWVCAIADAEGRIIADATLPTTTPAETLSRAAAFFTEYGVPEAVGVGSFGPLDLRVASPTFGHITTTPKPGWAHTDVVSALRGRLGVPIAIDTDVNAAALGEGRRGAGIGLSTFCYITVGTGIGGGVMVNGRLLHGRQHPEIGHLRVPRDRARDPFDGSCPYHQDCWEGLASGEAMRRRWGRRAEELSDDDDVWRLEADYLALGLVSVIHVLSPERVIVGGGVAGRPGLLSLVRERLGELVAGYLDLPPLDDYVVAPELGARAGVSGAVELARDAAEHTRETDELTRDMGG